MALVPPPWLRHWVLCLDSGITFHCQEKKHVFSEKVK